MTLYYITLPPEADLSGKKQVCITTKKNKITIDPECGCHGVKSISPEETQTEFEARRREEKHKKKKIESEEWKKVRTEKKERAKEFFYPHEQKPEESSKE